jgi:hypothetical protein
MFLASLGFGATKSEGAGDSGIDSDEGSEEGASVPNTGIALTGAVGAVLPL